MIEITVSIDFSLALPILALAEIAKFSWIYMNKHWQLYVLRLEDGKFYVGITSKTPDVRMREHQRGVRTAYWTAKHKPIEVIHSEDLGNTTKEKAERRENKLTRELMKQWGINNVRGGDLTDTSDYTVRFGRIYNKEGWQDAIYILIMFLVLGLFTIDKYFMPILPGGIN